MKAILYERHGGPEVLRFGDLPDPNPGAHEVVVKLKAASLNRMDLWVREGWSGLKLEYPHIPGADGAGEVYGVGEGVKKWSIGDEIVINPNLGCGNCDFCQKGMDNLCRNWHLLGETVRGTHAEFVVVPERQLVRLPEGFDPIIAAGGALVFQTAWHSLITRGNLRPGESILIIGASGGVNTACIQIAKYAGAIVYVVGSGQSKLELAESLGADFLINRLENENWSKNIYNLTKKEGIDVVVDNVGTTYPLSFRVVKKGGRILTVGNTGGAKFEIDNRFMFGKHLKLIGSTMGTLRDFKDVMTLIFSGELKVALDKTYPLKDAVAAHKRLELGEQMGKITFKI